MPISVNNNRGKQFFVTILLTTLLSSAGFALFHFGLIGYGYTFFILIPICIGYFLGLKLDWGISFVIALIIGLVCFFYLLIIAQLEWTFCIIILLPLFVPLIILGIWIGYLLKKYLQGNKKTDTLKFNLYPILILLFSGTIEHFFSNKFDYARAESTIYLPYDKETVYDYIKSVDTLDSKKPLLMKLGLSVPQKCILEKEEVGAKRTCHFEKGTIEEKVTDIRKGEIIRMEVTKYNLPGMQWLKFEEAAYLFTQKNGFTKLTRITTYRSQLKPRIYWNFWEKMAIKAQHEYVLNDLKRRLEREKK
jgi:hypothetical protein